MVSDFLGRYRAGVTQPLAWLVCKGIWLYQISLRVVIGPRCRFFPSCSDYAAEAFTRHGLFEGGRLTIRRLCRCRPGGGSGLDLVPDVVSPVVTKHEDLLKK